MHFGSPHSFLRSLAIASIPKDTYQKEWKRAYKHFVLEYSSAVRASWLRVLAENPHPRLVGLIHREYLKRSPYNAVTTVPANVY